METRDFKARAKHHQIKFREEILKAGKGYQEYHLSDADALRGLIFFDGYDILKTAQERYNNFGLKKACYMNMLRSEHIPFNFFVPLSTDLGYARDVINRFVSNIIGEITLIKIEHAPDPDIALNDKTSFDVYIEFNHIDGTEGIIGIEVKYTEGAYPLKDGSTESKAIVNPKHPYNVLTRKLGLYKQDKINLLKTDNYRQVWRNQLLGESITKRNHPEFRFNHFISILLYPEGNDHFREVISDYKDFLTPGHENSFIGITYEEFIATARQHTEDTELLRWLQYLEDRYIVKN